MRQITTLIFLLLSAFAEAQELKFAPGQSRAGDSVNIYNSNGTLTADRTVTQSTFDLNFVNSSNDCAIRNGSILGGASQGAGIEYDDGTDVYTVSIDATQSSLLWIDQSGGGKEGNASVTSTATSIGRLVSASQRNEYYADDGLSEMEMVDDQFGSAVQLAALSLVNGAPGTYSGVWLVRSGYTDDDDYITTKADLSQTDFSVSVRQATVNGVVGTPLNKLTLNATDLIVSDYPNTRDDGGTTAPINFLYTDGNGKILSSPTSGLGSGFWALTGNAGTDTSLNFFGTTDDQPVLFKVNNAHSGIIDENSGSTSLGWHSLHIEPTGASNTAFGAEALRDNAGGAQNAALGNQAGSLNVTGGNNVFLGCLTASATGGENNGVAIGYQASIEASGEAVFGPNVLAVKPQEDTAAYLGKTTDRWKELHSLRAYITTLVASGRINQKKGANVAAANNLTLGEDGNMFTITGNTQVNAITTASWQSGSVIHLIFTGTPTVKHNTAGGAGTAVMLLSGSVDLSATANTTLTLGYDGTVWQELSRKVP